MIPKAITFDCAQTIVQVDWTLDGFIRTCMAHAEYEISEDEAAQYKQLYFERLHEFLEINLRRDLAAGARFWHQLGRDWLALTGYDVNLVADLMRVSDELCFGPDSVLFRRYEDVIPCLEGLRQQGVRLAVVSNWDYSLHRVLSVLGLTPYFEFALASLEEGVEKPDPRLFDIALARLELLPSDVLHIGDNPIDDVEGATNAGIRALLIDRSLPRSQQPVIASLADLPKALEWTN